MRPHHIIPASGIVALLAIATSAVLTYATPSTVVASDAPVLTIPSTGPEPVVAEVVEAAPVETSASQEPASSTLGLPMADALARVTKKTFGMEIHPETSPVEQDRFNGFHVGVDFETTEDEQDIDVPVMAVCDGPFVAKHFAKGYGGYALQACTLDGGPVIVLYGHLRLESIDLRPAQELARGQVIGILGKGHSPETDGVRKHLHLGIHRGTGTDIRGYVQDPSEIGAWLDVMPYLKP